MAEKQLTEAQRLLLEQVAKGPLVYEALDGYGRRVAGALEDDDLLATVGENVEITAAGRAKLNEKKARGKPAPKSNGKTNGEHAERSAKAPAVPPWYPDARAYVEARHREDLLALDRLAGIRA